MATYMILYFLCLCTLLHHFGQAQTPCCYELQKEFPDTVSVPKTAAYNASQLSYWSQQEQTVQPSCVLRPRNSQAVSKALRILSRYQPINHATKGDCQFAIRGGGHHPWAGSANIEDGVTIDMSSIDAVDIAQSKKVVSVGAGARWSDVYSKLDALGIAVGGGRFSNVGVAGFITGGGMSFFAPRYGFVCDQVQNFEVVLADGQIVNANATSRADLWFALKGGSNNFGIVTRFDLKAFSQGKIWGGSVYNPITTLPDQIQAFVEFNNAASFDTNAALINIYAYIRHLGGWTASNILVYTKPEVNPRVLRPFTDIRPQLGSTMRLTNLSDVTHEQVHTAPVGVRQLFLTRTYGNDPHFLAQLFHIANQTLQSFSSTPGLVYCLVYQPLPPAITSHAAGSGGNPLGLDPADGPQVLAILTIQWSNAANDNLINSAARKIWQQADELAARMGLVRKWVYLNYAAEDQDPLGSYGEKNLGKLREASRKYDPTGLFQTGVPGGFKLWGKGGGRSGSVVEMMVQEGL